VLWAAPHPAAAAGGGEGADEVLDGTDTVVADVATETEDSEVKA
jgi:carbon-monoxide dehydrogenase small subunit